MVRIRPCTVRAPLLFGLVLCFTQPVIAREVIGTKRGKVYHLYIQDCASARKIQGDNRLTFDSEQAAQNAGRRLCKRCETLRQKASQPTSGKKQGASKPEPQEKEREQDDAAPANPPRSGADEPITLPPGGSLSAPDFAGIKKVLPGGTLLLDTGDNAILIGVVCPSRGQAASQDAVRFMTEQVRGRTVRMVYEDSPCREARRDELGRLLVYLTPEPDGRDLGGELLFQGYAWVDRRMSFARQAEYLRYEEEAWRAARGVWARGGEAGSSETVVTGRHSSCYHGPNCEHVRLLSGVMNMTLDEARARRLVPCSEFRSRK